MKKLEIDELTVLKIDELKSINGGEDPISVIVKKGSDVLGQFYGWLCSFASFKDSNSITQGYVGRGR